ncbi:putative leucine-rich repeat domain superfamily, F-box-like domain superfamily [Helianthus anomalus]
MSKKTVVAPADEDPVAVVAEEWRSWDGLNPEILGLIFVRIPIEEMVSIVPLVCKGWMEVVYGPYCWSEVDLEAWCRRRNDSHAVDMVVKKVVRRSKFRVQRLCVYGMGEKGWFHVAYCGNFLKVLQMPMTDITDKLVSKHIKPLPNLTVLDVSHCVNITSEGLKTFGHQCKSLLHLKRNMPAFEDQLPDDSEAKAIADTMPHLQHIELCFGRFGDSGVSEILAKCKALTHLVIQGSWNVELNGDLAEICERLQHFHSPWVDDDHRFSDMSECSDAEIAVSDSD